MAAIPGPLRALAAVAGGGAMAMTLSACYGAPCVGRSCGSSTTCSDPSLDIDGDGFCAELDCDEEDPSVHWSAMDATGDGKDNDCDGSDSMSTTGIRPTRDAGAPDAAVPGDAG